VTVTFERDVAPTGADYSNAIVVTKNGTAVAGTTTEPTPGTLSWTPSTALPAGSYQVTVDHVQSVIGSDSVPIQKPYTFSFTVQ
jgi:hypothetical protein